ncbi:MAG TPA: hypothetical protein VFP45_02240 [Candidatus Nitrosotalea sp.]|nr:hypothetical protein [Candidatus Nitrosotalea sp.]
MDFERKQLMKALAALAIERVLLDAGKPIFEKVSNKLQKEYKCYIPDCYDHPDYLGDVLKSIFGNSYVTIVEQIKRELVEYSDDKDMELLIKTIGR